MPAIRYILDVGNSAQASTADVDDAVAEHLIRSGAAVLADGDAPEPSDPVGDEPLDPSVPDATNTDPEPEPELEPVPEPQPAVVETSDTEGENPDVAGEVDPLDGMSGRELKSYAESLGLKTYGNPDAVRGRIRAHLAKSNSATDGDEGAEN